MEKESAPLAGYKVVVSGVHVMKARISALFSAWGADVVEIAARSTQGDGARFVPPLYGENDSYFFWCQNYGRRRIVALAAAHSDGSDVEPLSSRAMTSATSSVPTRRSEESSLL